MSTNEPKSEPITLDELDIDVIETYFQRIVIAQKGFDNARITLEKAANTFNKLVKRETTRAGVANPDDYVYDTATKKLVVKDKLVDPVK